MLLPTIIAAAWAVLTLLALVLCVAARRADIQQRTPPVHADERPPRPSPNAIHRAIRGRSVSRNRRHSVGHTSSAPGMCSEMEDRPA